MRLIATSSILVKIVGDSKSAESAIDKVGQKAEEVLGRSLGGTVTKALSRMPVALTAATIGIAAVGAAVGVVSGKLAQMSDAFTLINSRIALMNDGTQTNAALLDKIAEAANRSRASYHDLANTISKLGLLAGSAFSSNDEMVLFAEQMNKQFKIGGASIQEQTAAMYQLTQAMAAGRLQGDEFRSIMENAPMLAQAIATEMGVPVGKLKEMAAEGAITADVIKQAMFNTAEETNAQFAAIPLTFSDSMLMLSNTALKAFEPVFKLVGSITSSAEFQAGLEAAKASIQSFASITYSALNGVSTAYTSLKNIVGNIGNAIKGAFSAVPGVMAAVTASMAGYLAYTQAAALTTQALTIKSVAYNAVLATKKVLFSATTAGIVAYKSAVGAYNAVMAVSITRVTVWNALTKSLAALASLGAVKTAILTAAQAALNAVMSMNPIAIVIGLLAALGAAFAASSIASNGLKATLSNVWNSIVHTTTWAINGIIKMINALIGALNTVGSKLGQVFKFDYSAIGEIAEISAESAQSFADSVGNMANNAFGGMDVTAVGGGAEAVGTGGGGGSSSGGTANQALEEAKRLHQSISDEWANIFKTKVELADRWRDKELAELEKSKAANENYEADRQMIMELYAKKREDALLEESMRMRELQNKARDLAQGFNFSLLTKGQSGEALPTEKLINDHEVAVNAIRDKWQALSDEFAQMTDREQATFKAALDARGLQYELDAQNRISFEKVANEQILAEREKLTNALTEATANQLDREAQIKQAMAVQDMEAFKSLVDEKYAIQEADMLARQELMTAYLEAAQEAHGIMLTMMTDFTKNIGDSIGESISGLLQGTMSVQTAFTNLGKTMLKTIGDFVGQWIAGRLKMFLFGKLMGAKDAAASVAQAAAQIPVWQQLAVQRSLATAGASAVAGAAAYQTASASMTLPAFANGGIVDRPTVALIGEGRYKEAVVPFNERTFNAIGEGVAGASSATGNVTIHVSAMDVQSFEGWLERSAGQVVKQYLFNQNREFASEVGTW